MVGIGLIEVETVYPLFLGSNIGTTFTAILAALTESGSDLFKETVQGALVHLFFNVLGIAIFFPFPPLRYVPCSHNHKLGLFGALKSKMLTSSSVLCSPRPIFIRSPQISGPNKSEAREPEELVKITYVFVESLAPFLK